jgi:hypothetical protein
MVAAVAAAVAVPPSPSHDTLLQSTVTAVALMLMTSRFKSATALTGCTKASLLTPVSACAAPAELLTLAISGCCIPTKCCKRSDCAIWSSL